MPDFPAGWNSIHVQRADRFARGDAAHRFRQQFGQRSYTEFMLEYQLANFLRLETRLSPETSGIANRLTQRRVERGGIDLIFFFSY